MPAQAGTQIRFGSSSKSAWIPASAGMTEQDSTSSRQIQNPPAWSRESFSFLLEFRVSHFTLCTSATRLFQHSITPIISALIDSSARVRVKPRRIGSFLFANGWDETMMKRSVSGILLSVLLLLGCIGSGFAADTIRIAYSSVNPHALLVSLAEKRGLYAKYGLSSVVVYIPGGSTVVQTMVSGDVDLGQLTGAPGVAANLRGADIVYIAMTDDTMGYQVATRRDIKSPAELKGKRFGISRFASHPILVLALF